MAGLRCKHHPTHGGLAISEIRPGTLADQLGLADGDLLVVLAGAQVSMHGDLDTALRVMESLTGPIEAEWIRDDSLHASRKRVVPDRSS